MKTTTKKPAFIIGALTALAVLAVGTVAWAQAEPQDEPQPAPETNEAAEAPADEDGDETQTPPEEAPPPDETPPPEETAAEPAAPAESEQPALEEEPTAAPPGVTGEWSTESLLWRAEKDSRDSEILDIGDGPTGASGGGHLTMSVGTGDPLEVRLLGIYELHFNAISDDYSANDWLSYYMVKGSIDVTENNQLAVRMDMEQRYIADPNENGFWLADMRFYYSRKFSIPIPNFEIPGKGSLWLTAPTSRVSRARSYVTKPTLEATLVPSYGPFSLYTTGFFQYKIAKYAESNNDGDLNTLLETGYQLQLVYQPVAWFSPSVMWYQAFEKPYASREGVRQAWQPYYYYEVAANFTVPTPEQAPGVDLMLAFSQGANMLQDGVYRMYLSKRDQTDIYFGMTLTY